MSILKILDEVAATTKRSEKLSILEQHKDNDTLKRVFRAAYNPYVNYYIRLPVVVLNECAPNGTISLDDALNTLKAQIASREVTGNKAHALLCDVISKLSVEDAEVFFRIVDRDLRVGCSDSTANKVWKDLIPEFEIMACQSLNDKTESRVKPGWYSQLKYDAARVVVKAEVNASGEVIVSYLTRAGRPYHLKNANIDEVFTKARKMVNHDLVFDGELFQFNSDGSIAPRKFSNGVANKMIHDTATPEQHANAGIAVWDVISAYTFADYKKYPSEKYSRRLSSLYDMIGESAEVFVAKTEVITDLDHALEIARGFMKEGLEGSIIKDPEGLWEAKRSFSCLKIKAIREADLEIVEVHEGTGRLVGRLGAIECVSSCGKLRVNVGSGFKDHERDLDKTLVGRIVTVRFNELIVAKGSDTHSLFLPRFVELRHDKFEADTLQKIKDEIANE